MGLRSRLRRHEAAAGESSVAVKIASVHVLKSFLSSFVDVDSKP